MRVDNHEIRLTVKDTVTKGTQHQRGSWYKDNVTAVEVVDMVRAVVACDAQYGCTVYFDGPFGMVRVVSADLTPGNADKWDVGVHWSGFDHRSNLWSTSVFIKRAFGGE